MATLTRNLFVGAGEGTFRLDVTEGHWPDDMDGWVFVVGPDKREPGGHWFGAHGLLCRIDCRPDADGRITTRFERVATPVERLRRRLPSLFKHIEFGEVSPFGVTNMANTNVTAIDGRLFLGYDAGRPVEVDPVTLGYVTAVGGNDEWLQSVPGLLEPLVQVAAHPAADLDEHALYFVNYSPLPGAKRPSIARWSLDGPLLRWDLDGIEDFDSIHDVKACRDYVVISDLPFVVEPEAMRRGPDGSTPARTIANQDHTQLFIVAKADLRATAAGGAVPVTTVRLPMPTGHLSVDVDNDGTEIVVHLEHIPLADLMLRVGPDTVDHRHGDPMDPAYEGLVALAVQPGAVGRYRIDAVTGEVLAADVLWDEQFWGPVLATRDESTRAAMAHHRDLWFAGLGFDPDLVSQAWWDLYATSGNTALVPMDELPEVARPGALTRFDLDARKIADRYEYADGAFPSPPTFVPRRDADGPGDGYIVAMVHRDGPKALHVFDARDLERGPLAVATAPRFNPPLLLHSCWMPVRSGPRPSTYRIGVARDVRGAVAGVPKVLASWFRMGRAMAVEMRAAKASSRTG